MWFKHRAWIPVAWILAGINLVAVWPAARAGEAWHAATHGLLAVGFALGAVRLTARHRAESRHDELQQALDANEQLQQAVDGMQARIQELEERLDFTERLLATQREADRLGSTPPRRDP